MGMSASACRGGGFTRAGPGELSGAVGAEPVFLRPPLAHSRSPAASLGWSHTFYSSSLLVPHLQQLLPGLPGLTAFPRLLRASNHSLRSSSIHGPFQYGPNLLCLPHLSFFCTFYPVVQSSRITAHPLPRLPGRRLHVSHRLAAGLLQNVFTLEPKLLPKHCHAGDGK